MRVASFASLLLPLALLTAPAAAQTPATPTPRAAAAERPVWPDEGPRRWAPRPTSAKITANDLRTRLYQFADDSMLGRRIGEASNAKGTDYIAREFKRLGFKPAGDSGSYFQTLAYGPLGFDSAASRLSVGGRALVAGRDWLPTVPTAANGLGGSASIENPPTVFGGRWGGAQLVFCFLFKIELIRKFYYSPISFWPRRWQRTSSLLRAVPTGSATS